MVRRWRWGALALMTAGACANDPTAGSASGDTGVGPGSAQTGSDEASASATSASATGSATGVDGSSSSTGGAEGSIFDVGLQTTGDTETGGIVPSCKVGDDMDAPQPCVDVAPPDSFEPDVQWAWPGYEGETQVLGTPVVGNLTDDNGDGAIDLCDVPDVVVIAYGGASIGTVGHLYVLDGETGAMHYRIDQDVHAILYPALGDLDGDGVPEIIAATADQIGMGYLIAFHHDGTLAWQSPTPLTPSSNAIGLADLEGDGDVEILFAGGIYDHLGNQVLAPTVAAYLNTAADLDGDDDLEVVFGGRVIHHDGTLYGNAGDATGHPHVADLDMDGEPEVMTVSFSGITIMQHDGTVTTSNAVPNLANWRPAAIHDMDGDMQPEIAVGSSNTYSVLETDLTANWTAVVSDGSGYAAGTAFDFLGDGTAEAMYADETTLFIFDEVGAPLLTTNRESWTQWENPVVADVDNDGSAEIVVVSNAGYNNGMTAPVQVIRDAEDRWIPARRIWNQHGYHVTNVREDGTIPAVQPKNWLTLNTFRTQSQIDAGGGVCVPEPRG